MKRDDSIKSKLKKRMTHRFGISIIVALVILGAMISGVGSVAAIQSGSQSGIPAMGGVVAQTDDYNLTQSDFGSQPITVGETVRVTTVVTNTGDERLNTKIGLGTEGQVVDSQKVNLYPGSSQQISFTYSYDSPGTYAMHIGSLNESDVMTQIGVEDSTVKVISKDTSANLNGQFGASATTQPSDASAIPTLTANQTESGSISPTGQAKNLTVTHLTITSGSPPYQPGNLISFEANITNPTSRQLNGSFTFAVDNGTVSQQTLTVPADGDQSIIFTHRFAKSGRHTISVGDQTTSITVQLPQTATNDSANASTTDTNASVQSQSGDSGGIISTVMSSFVGIAGIVALLVFSFGVLFFGWLRFSASKENINR